jgi:thiol:disulfide interchange protein DsbC
VVNAKWSIFALGLMASGAYADDAAVLTKEQLAAKLPGVEAGQISEAPMPGIYQVAIGTNIAYVTADGRYAFEGELYDLQNGSNVTEQTRAEARVDLLAAVDPAQMIIFRPKDGAVKHRVMIFTDVDCGYCRQFHRDIDKVTALGIEVDYLSFPRTGPNTESWTKAEHVWCAKDRNVALTEAKLGGAVPDASCASTPVEAEYNLGHLVGVRGTPAIFSEQGELLGGYLTPKQLLDSLEKSDQ